MTSSAPHRGVDDEGDPADGDEEDAGTVDLVEEDLVLPRQQYFKPAGSVATWQRNNQTSPPPPPP